jgi:hypothetical protein
MVVDQRPDLGQGPHACLQQSQPPEVTLPARNPHVCDPCRDATATRQAGSWEHIECWKVGAEDGTIGRHTVRVPGWLHFMDTGSGMTCHGLT